MDPSFQQHMLVTKGPYSDLLHSIQLCGRIVIEIGVGTGQLTKLILENNPEKIIGYEIDPNFSDSVSDSLKGVNLLSKLELIIADFLQADLSFVNPTHCLISNPPYDLLKQIAPLVTGENSIFHDVILMVPEKKLGLFPDFKIAFTLNENDFDPPTKPGKHIVIIKGF